MKIEDFFLRKYVIHTLNIKLKKTFQIYVFNYFYNNNNVTLKTGVMMLKSFAIKGIN